MMVVMMMMMMVVLPLVHSNGDKMALPYGAK